MMSPHTSEAIPLDEIPLGEDGIVIVPSSNKKCGFRWSCMNFLSSFATLIIAGMTIFLFVQMQYLTFEMSTQAKHLADLEERYENQTAPMITELNNKVVLQESWTLYQMAGLFVLLACLLTMFHMTTHLRHYYQPDIQRKIVTILWMSPVYSVTSFFSLVFPIADGYLAVVKDFYEAYAISTFLSFLIAVLGEGDRDVAAEVLSKHADHLKKPYRCLMGCFHPPPATSDVAMASAVITECQILTMVRTVYNIHYAYWRQRRSLDYSILFLTFFITAIRIRQTPHFNTTICLHRYSGTSRLCKRQVGLL
jgi:hypothetical protein